MLFTPYQRIAQPDGAILLRPGAPVEILDDEIGTAEAGRIIGVSARQALRYCDEGILVEGVDWRRPAGKGFLKIKRAAAMRLAGREGNAP